MSIRVERLAHAIEGRLGVAPEVAADMAQRVLTYFGFESRIIDNLIDQEDRKLFYELFDAGILRSSLETVLLPSGRNWRIFYWEIDADAVQGKRPADPETQGDTVYRELPAEAWKPRASPS